MSAGPEPGRPLDPKAKLAAVEERPAGARGALSRRQSAALVVLILAVSGAIAFALLETGPVAERRARPRQARLVEVTPVERSTEVTRIAAMGNVVATRQVDVQPQVSGRIVWVSPEFVPGGRFAAGDVMLRIEPRDYELAVRQREADLAQARADLKMEEGNQSVARLEYELLGEAVPDEDRELVLRLPQLETVRARVASAEAALAQARLDLERTEVRAPFDALVRARSTELGARVDPGTDLATLVETGAYWVEVLVPVTQLRWIEIPRTSGEPGSLARVHGPGGGPVTIREGRVERLLGDLESEGRMARLLVRIDDPLALAPEHAGMPPLLLDSFVHLEIEGRPMENVVALDRALLRDHDRVWVMGRDGALEIRDVVVAFRGDDEVFVSEGLAGGEQVVVSELSSPVPGMPLRSATGPQSPPSGAATAEARRGG
ncbi:MAG: efflux RND transporter periplasmic adaptor subunit [Myxococcota bacterium]